MSYKIGDQFIVEITDISDSGMGMVFYLDDLLTVTDKNIDKLTPIESPVEEVKPAKKEKQTHTPEELKNKIFALSKLLANTIETYQKVTSEIDGAGYAIDLALEDGENG